MGYFVFPMLLFFKLLLLLLPLLHLVTSCERVWTLPDDYLAGDAAAAAAAVNAASITASSSSDSCEEGNLHALKTQQSTTTKKATMTNQCALNRARNTLRL